MAFNFHAMHSPEMVQELRGFLALTRSRRCLVDVGAHYGLFSLVFSFRPGTVAYAVEPSPEARKMLEHHLAVNPGLDVRVWPVALGRSQGELTFSIGDHGHALRSPGAELVTLPVRTLDGLVDQERARPDAVKIDVEGMELEVLEGARKTLSELRPQIFLEVHPSELVASGRRVAEVDALLRAADDWVRDTGAEPVSDLEAFCNGAIRRVVARLAGTTGRRRDGPASRWHIPWRAIMPGLAGEWPMPPTRPRHQAVARRAESITRPPAVARGPAQRAESRHWRERR